MTPRGEDLRWVALVVVIFAALCLAATFGFWFYAAADEGARQRRSGRMRRPPRGDLADDFPSRSRRPLWMICRARDWSPGDPVDDGAPPDERKEPVTAKNPVAVAHDFSARPVPTPFGVPACSHPGEPAGDDRVSAPVEPGRWLPPVIGGASPAARLPWLLPEEPSQPGITADEAKIGDLRLRAASVVGPGHRCEAPAKARQDAYRLGRDSTGQHLLVAVADGMSDSDRSDLGAAIAASEAVAFLRAALDQGADLRRLSAADLFAGVAKQMAGAAHQRGIGPAAVRATLVAMAIPTAAGPDGSREAWIGHVGDSSVWVRQEPSWLRVAGDEKSSGDSGLRHFLPHSPAAAVDRRVSLTPGDVVAVLTDGVADAFGKVPTASLWFSNRWRTPPPVASFLLDVSFEARGQQDDRTAVVVWCPEPWQSRGRR